MYLQTSQYHLIKGKHTNIPIQQWEDAPYLLIQPQTHLLYLEWEIILDETRLPVGTIALKQLKDLMTFEIVYDWEIEDTSVEVVLECLKLVMDYAFGTLRIQTLVIRLYALDFKMMNLVQRLGMTLEEKIMIGGVVFSVYSLSHDQQHSMMKMRSSSLVQSQILQFVKQEEPIRLMIQTGQRLNKHAPIDLLRDYHYRLFIQDNFFYDYLHQSNWMNHLGEVVISRKSVLSDYAYLFQIQFKDGVRLDLEFISIHQLWAVIYEETLSKVILDKDDLLHALDEPYDSAYYVQRPTEEEFHQLLNNVWWYQIEVAKALYRDEVPLVIRMYEGELLQEITTLLSWKIGIKYDWKVDLGRHKRWLKRYLPEHTYLDYVSFCSIINPHSVWENLFSIEPFVQKLAKEIGSYLGYAFDHSQGDKVKQFLHRMNSLPDNATDFNH